MASDLSGPPPLEYRLWHALERIRKDDGKVCDIRGKAKALRKFGRTVNADSGVKTTIANFPDGVANETFETTNAVTSIVSSDAADDAVVRIEGHTIDGSGNLTFVVQDATLNGQTIVALTTPLARCTRISVKDGTFASPATGVAGTVAVFYGTATSGVPDTAANVKCQITAGVQQSQKCATSVSATDYLIITEISAGLRRGNSSTVAADVEMEVARIGGVFLPRGLELELRTGATASAKLDLNPCIIVPSNSDVRMVATSNTNDTSVKAFFGGYLASVKKARINGRLVQV